MNQGKLEVVKQKTIIYGSNNMTFWKKQNYGDSKKISVGQGLKVLQGMNRKIRRVFSTVKTLFIVV